MRLGRQHEKNIWAAAHVQQLGPGSCGQGLIIAAFLGRM